MRNYWLDKRKKRLGDKKEHTKEYPKELWQYVARILAGRRKKP